LDIIKEDVDLIVSVEGLADPLSHFFHVSLGKSSEDLEHKKRRTRAWAFSNCKGKGVVVGHWGSNSWTEGGET
jgi:hypothetical protein